MKDKIINILIFSLAILSAGAVAFLFVKYLLPVLLPFIIAWIVAMITRSPSEKLAGRMKMPSKVTHLITALVSTLIIVSLAVFLVWQATAALWRLLTDLGQGDKIYEIFNSILSPTGPIFSLIPEEMASRITESLGSLLSGALSYVASGVTRLVGAVPTAFLFLLVTVISLVYFSLDYDRITAAIASILPERVSSRLTGIRDGVISVVGKYLRSYALILLITYITVFLGLTLLKVQNSPLIAMFIALLDILPVIGVGTVLVPWSIFELAMGNKFLGIGLLLLFVVNAIIRQLSEPKIVGKSLNIHPLLSLGAIYLGYALFGFAGVLILPLIAVGLSAVLKNNSATKVD